MREIIEAYRCLMCCAWFPIYRGEGVEIYCEICRKGMSHEASHPE